jgi:hypothetical protein
MGSSSSRRLGWLRKTSLAVEQSRRISGPSLQLAETEEMRQGLKDNGLPLDQVTRTVVRTGDKDGEGGGVDSTSLAGGFSS